MTKHLDRNKLASPSPIPRPLKNFKEAIYQHLREAILSQRIKPSARLQEKAIAQQFGVSITPVREAIRKLEGEGYLEVYGHRGVRVRTISDAELMEIYRVLGPLDSYATCLAMQRMSPKEFQDLQEQTDEIEPYCREDKIAEYLHANMRVHAFVWRQSGNRFLAHTLDQIHTRMLQYPKERIALHSEPGVLKKSMVSHRRILKAMKAGKVKLVEHLCRDHWDSFVDAAWNKKEHIGPG